MNLNHIEYEIVDHCNLACENCSHFSYLKPKKFVSLDNFEADLKAITNKFTLNRFTLIGGEPTLHPKLIELIKLAKTYLNNTELRIATNGIKLINKSDIFYKLLNLLNVRIILSKYNLNVNYNKIIDNCKKFSVKLTVKEQGINGFFEILDSTGQVNSEDSFKACRERFFCPTFFKNRLYTCSYSKSSSFLTSINKLPKEAVDEGISIDSSDDEISKYLSKPVITCKYCKVRDVTKPWKLVK